MNNVPYLGSRILKDIIQAYKDDTSYYWSDAMEHLSDEDTALLEEQEIYDYITKVLADEYSLVVKPVLRSFKDKGMETGIESSEEDFQYLDTQLYLESNT